MKLPISVYTAITVQDMALLKSPIDITQVMIGTSPNRPRITDDQLRKPVASYPAYAMIEHDELVIYTAMEYGNSLGVYEIGIYAGEVLVATINQKSRYEINKPIFALRHDRTYIFDIRVKLSQIDGVRNRGALALGIDERDDITYPMAMAIQHNAALTMVASEQVRLQTQLDELLAEHDENSEIVRLHAEKLNELDHVAALHTDAINELQAMPIMEAYHTANTAKTMADQLVDSTNRLTADVVDLTQALADTLQEAKNKVRLKSKHERLLIMHDVEDNLYELTLTDVAKASVLAAEIIRRQHENARIREEIENKIEGKLDERQVRALIAEAELDDVTRDEIKLAIIESVADKMTDERVSELMSHKMNTLDAERLLAEKASHDEVASRIESLYTEIGLRLDAKVDDDALSIALAKLADGVPTHAEVSAMIADKGNRLELESKIKAVNDKAIHNHLLIDELTRQQVGDNQRINAINEKLGELVRSETMAVLRADVEAAVSRIDLLPDQMHRIAKQYIDVLTQGASGAMDTFAEVEAALNNGDSVADGILAHIDKLARGIDEIKQNEAIHRQFTGYKTATNLTQIVALILD